MPGTGALFRQAQERLATIEKESQQRIRAAKDAMQIIAPVLSGDDETSDLQDEYQAIMERIDALLAQSGQDDWKSKLAAVKIISEVSPFINAVQMRKMNDEEAAIMTILLAA
jgi:hypothetical protein